jgi:hypothetical protein
VQGAYTTYKQRVPNREIGNDYCPGACRFILLVLSCLLLQICHAKKDPFARGTVKCIVAQICIPTSSSIGRQIIELFKGAYIVFALSWNKGEFQWAAYPVVDAVKKGWVVVCWKQGNNNNFPPLIGQEGDGQHEAEQGTYLATRPPGVPPIWEASTKGPAVPAAEDFEGSRPRCAE